MSIANPDRRGFLKLTSSALALLALSKGQAKADTPPAPDPKQVPDTRATLTAGTVKDYRKAGNFFLVSDTKGIYAVSSLCTHAGCSVHKAEGAFECPCHGSAFDLAGAVTAGPAKLALAHFEVRESSPGGPLIVNPGKTVSPDARL